MSLFASIVIVLLAMSPSRTGRPPSTLDSHEHCRLDSFRDNANECCQTGRIQAESTKTCTTTLESLLIEKNTNTSVNCRFLSHICCLSNLRSYYCEEGLKTALRLLPCNETKLESKDTYQVSLECLTQVDDFFVDGVRSAANAVNWVFEQVEISKIVHRWLS